MIDKSIKIFLSFFDLIIFFKSKGNNFEIRNVVEKQLNVEIEKLSFIIY